MQMELELFAFIKTYVLLITLKYIFILNIYKIYRTTDTN